MKNKIAKLGFVENNGYVYLLEIGKDLYKIGLSKNVESRVKWLSLEYEEVSVVRVWETPDRYFCERVALAMTRRYDVDKGSEKRSMNDAQVSEFITDFASFIKRLDYDGAPSLGADTTVAFICYHEDNSEITLENGEILTMDELKTIANILLVKKENFSRRTFAKYFDFSQNDYHKRAREFTRLGFLVMRGSNNRTLTNKGYWMLKSILGEESETKENNPIQPALFQGNGQ